MSKKIFICGKVYDTAAATKDQIQKIVQKRINQLTINPDAERPEQLVALELSIDPNYSNIEFTFKRNNLFAKEGVNPDLINDSDAMLIMGLDGNFRPPVMWDLVQTFGVERYHVPISEFVYAYAESIKALGASELKGVQIESSKTELKLKIRI